jgi:hypothetical protein
VTVATPVTADVAFLVAVECSLAAIGHAPFVVGI